MGFTGLAGIREGLPVKGKITTHDKNRWYVDPGSKVLLVAGIFHDL